MTGQLVPVVSAVWQIVKNTFKESIRQPIYLLLLLSSLLLIGFSPYIAMFTFRESTKLVTDTSLATMLLFGWIAAVLCASHAISREIDTGTVLMVLSKPVNRVAFIFAKIAGIILSLTVFCYLNAIACLLALRIGWKEFNLDYLIMILFFAGIALSCVIGAIRNYQAKRSFTMATTLYMVGILTVVLGLTALIPAPHETPAIDVKVVPALVLVAFAVWAIGSLATALSTRLAVVPNLIICVFVFLGGVLSEYIFKRLLDEIWIAEIGYAAIPNWQFFWVADALAADKTIPHTYLLLGAAYIVLLMALFTLLGVLLFLNREVGQQRVS